MDLLSHLLLPGRSLLSLLLDLSGPSLLWLRQFLQGRWDRWGQLLLPLHRLPWDPSDRLLLPLHRLLWDPSGPLLLLLHLLP